MHACPTSNSIFFLLWSPIKLTTDIYSLPLRFPPTEVPPNILFQGGQGSLDLEVMGQAPSLADFLFPSFLPGDSPH